MKTHDELRDEIAQIILGDRILRPKVHGGILSILGGSPVRDEAIKKADSIMALVAAPADQPVDRLIRCGVCFGNSDVPKEGGCTHMNDRPPQRQIAERNEGSRRMKDDDNTIKEAFLSGYHAGYSGNGCGPVSSSEHLGYIESLAYEMMDKGVKNANAILMHCEVIRRLATKRESGWQPIETAPKDDWVLISDGSDIDFARHDTKVSDTPVWLDFSADVAGQQPTHWMPLPMPPTNQIEVEKP